MAASQQPGGAGETRPKPYHHGDLRNALLDEALEVLRVEGSANFTLRDLARRVGVSHAAPYAHFPDKRALLAAVATIGFRALCERLRAADAAAADPLERLAAIGEAYVRFGCEEPAHYRLMFTVPELRRYDGLPELERAALDAFAVVQHAFAVLHDGAVIRSGDRQLDAVAAWSLAHGVTLLLIDSRAGIDTRSPEVVEQLVRTSIATMIAGLTRPER
ncbi:MAG TPA: TetR/AcrR family transcriptional regulator [Candidatus Limnocylindria bacterium]|nr:TetR/AcrR family transcriptional regulator [Candidatus Limnocylindria bacterium]